MMLTRNEFACASGDKMVYIRRFSEKGSEMTLTNTLQGHDSEVTQVKWSSFGNNWITASEDGTIRLWVGILQALSFFSSDSVPLNQLCWQKHNCPHFEKEDNMNETGAFSMQLCGTIPMIDSATKLRNECLDFIRVVFLFKVHNGTPSDGKFQLLAGGKVAHFENDTASEK